MSETNKLCTIAIPVYNRKDFIKKSLESALAQDVENLEILVVDNCSNDGTWKILQTYKDPRLRLVQNESNLGLFGNFNRCLELAKGKYMCTLCSDDELVPGCIRYEVELMEKCENAVLLSSRGKLFDERGCDQGMCAYCLKPGIYNGVEVINEWIKLFANYLFNYPSGILLKRECANNIGRFKTKMKLAGDVELYLKLLERGDLIVSDNIGCKIMLHKKQEGMQLGGLVQIPEALEIVNFYKKYLKNKDFYQLIVAQITVLSLRRGLRWILSRKLKNSLPYFKLISKSKVRLDLIVIAFIRTLMLRLMLAVTGKVNVNIFPEKRF